jgi:hypothetical protein
MNRKYVSEWRMLPIEREYFSQRKFFLLMLKIGLCFSLNETNFHEKEIFYMNENKMYQSGEPFSLKENIFPNDVNFIP